MSDSTTDLLVIGGGPGGYPAAIRAAQNGATVTLVNAGPLGGVCLNEGCIPSKGLLDAAEIVHRAGSLFGVSVDGAHAFATAQQRNKVAIAQLRTGIAGLLRAAGVKVIDGTACFVSDQEVEVHGGTDERLSFTHAIVATGSSPTTVSGFDGVDVLGARDVLELEHMPSSAVVLGAGAVGLELASVLCRFGADVHVVEALAAPLPATDAGLVNHLVRALESEGITFHLASRARSVGTGEVSIEPIAEEGTPLVVAADVVVVAAGRQPRTADLGLDVAGVDTDDRGAIRVDDSCRSSNPRVFAVGDVTPGPGLAHRATSEGLRVADLLTREGAVVTPLVIPSVVYTDPTLISVGHTETGAKNVGLDVRAHRIPLAANGRSIVTGSTAGEVVLVARSDDGVVVGVHAVGHGVESLAQVGVTAIELGAVVEDLASMVTPHPSVGESLTEAAHLAEGNPVHVPRPRRARGER